jgi:hypothetical protein
MEYKPYNNKKVSKYLDTFYFNQKIIILFQLLKQYLKKTMKNNQESIQDNKIGSTSFDSKEGEMLT